MNKDKIIKTIKNIIDTKNNNLTNFNNFCVIYIYLDF